MTKEISGNCSFDVLDEGISSLLNDECFIGTWEQSPAYLQDNEYIKRGYRINFNTTKRILRSLFMCHNETTNIWSHLLAAILFTGFMVYIGGWISFSESEETYLPSLSFNNSDQITSLYQTTDNTLYTKQIFNVPNYKDLKNSESLEQTIIDEIPICIYSHEY